jgi:hypothetical protein
MKDRNGDPKDTVADGDSFPCPRYLGGGQSSCRPDRKFQNLAQGCQIGVPGTGAVLFPEIYARRADIDLLGNLCNAEAAAEASSADLMGEDRLACHGQILLFLISNCIR